MLEELDLPAWVEKAPPGKASFREAVHIVLHAISTSLALRSTMVIKGGIRNRNRRQDVYDLNLLIASGTTPTAEEKRGLLELLATSCRERGIEPNRGSFANPEIKRMASEGYQDLAPEVEGELPPFEEAYARVQAFYEDLPWDYLPAATPEANGQASAA